MAPGGRFEHHPGWAAKLPGAVARIAAIQTLAYDPSLRAIPSMIMGFAIDIGDWLAAHALAAFDMAGTTPEFTRARLLLGWIQRRGSEYFTKRDAIQALKGSGHRSVRRVEDLEGALVLLEELGWIRAVQESPRDPGQLGRSRSQTYFVNPSTLFRVGKHGIAGNGGIRA